MTIEEKQFRKAVFTWQVLKKPEKERPSNTQANFNKISREWQKILVYMKRFKNQLLLVFMEIKKSRKLLLACYSVDQESSFLIKQFLEEISIFYYWGILQQLNPNFWNSFKKQLQLQYTQVEKVLQLRVWLPR